MRHIKLILAILAITIATGVKAQSFGDILNAIGNATATDNFNITTLKGTYKYKEPAVSFKSDEMLGSIGGAALSSQLETKLKPYFKASGIQNLSINFDGNSNFTAKIKGKEIKGHIERDSTSTDMLFYFETNGKTWDKPVKAMVTKSGNNINVMFDATRLLELSQSLSGALNISSLQTIATLLSKYKGAYVGVRLKK